MKLMLVSRTVCMLAFAVTVPLAADEPEPVKVGDVAPGFELFNQHGEKVSLAQFKGKRSVVLAFSRAHW